MKKKIITICTALAAFLAISGFVSPFRMHNEAAIKKALEEDYGQEFEIVSYERNGYISAFFANLLSKNAVGDHGYQPYVRVVAKPADDSTHPYLLSPVLFDAELLDSGDVYDDYVEKRICRDITVAMDTNLDSTLEDVGFRHFAYCQSNLEGYASLEKDATVTDWLETFPSQEIDCYLFLETDVDEIDADVLSDISLSILDGTEDFQGSLTVYLVEDIGDVSEYLESNTRVDGYADSFDYLGRIAFETHSSGVGLTSVKAGEWIADYKEYMEE